MAFVPKDGQGSLFKNDRKEKDSHPDYKGSILIDGTDFWLSAWIKEGAKGKFMSLSAQPKEATTRKPERQPGQDDDEALPF